MIASVTGVGDVVVRGKTYFSHDLVPHRGETVNVEKQFGKNEITVLSSRGEFICIAYFQPWAYANKVLSRKRIIYRFRSFICSAMGCQRKPKEVIDYRKAAEACIRNSAENLRSWRESMGEGSEGTSYNG